MVGKLKLADKWCLQNRDSNLSIDYETAEAYLLHVIRSWQQKVGQWNSTQHSYHVSDLRPSVLVCLNCISQKCPWKVSKMVLTFGPLSILKTKGLQLQWVARIRYFICFNIWEHWIFYFPRINDISFVPITLSFAYPNIYAQSRKPSDCLVISSAKALYK